MYSSLYVSNCCSSQLHHLDDVKNAFLNDCYFHKEELYDGIHMQQPLSLLLRLGVLKIRYGLKQSSRALHRILCVRVLTKNDRSSKLKLPSVQEDIMVHENRNQLISKVVAGRFVNVYSTNDWILGVTFRASLLTQGLAGIQAVDVPGIENVDATNLIEGHSSYLEAVPQILTQLEIDTYYPVFNSTPSRIE